MVDHSYNGLPVKVDDMLGILAREKKGIGDFMLGILAKGKEK